VIIDEASEGRPWPRVTLGGVPIDALRLGDAIAAIDGLVSARRGGAVFTPNVDHVVEFEKNADLRRAYASADLSLVDGMPVLWASRLAGRFLPEKVSGSDLIFPLLEHAAVRGWRVFLLGGGEGVAVLAASKLKERFPPIQIAGTLSPRIDMREPAERRRDVVETVKAARPDIVVVALGAPKQELWIEESRVELEPAVLLGLGASLDFVAGTLARAPAWMSRSGLEWLYRLGREPRRLWRRYLLRDPRFFIIVLKDVLAARRRQRRSEGG
jgi:N-acetylglucosaminyldiphosphoundecaprenol N-acetyl-beta-D-mannosaminyltransferase